MYAFECARRSRRDAHVTGIIIILNIRFFFGWVCACLNSEARRAVTQYLQTRSKCHGKQNGVWLPGPREARPQPSHINNFNVNTGAKSADVICDLIKFRGYIQQSGDDRGRVRTRFAFRILPQKLANTNPII